MQNFLRETDEMITSVDKTWSDVVYIGSEDYYISVATFVEIADVEYYSGYGSNEMPRDIIVVFSDGSWLERWEYDGAEGWVYKSVIDYSNAKQLPIKAEGYKLSTDELFPYLIDFAEEQL